MFEEVIGLTLYKIDSDEKLECYGDVKDIEADDNICFSDTYRLRTPYKKSSFLDDKGIYKMLYGEVFDGFFFAEKVYPINIVLARESEKATWRERWWEIYVENYKHGCMETIVQDTDSAIARAINGSYSFFKDRGEKFKP